MGKMCNDYDRFSELLSQDYRLATIEVKVTKVNGYEEEAKLTFKKMDDSVTFTTSEEKLLDYVTRLHSIPHIDDDDSDFMYIEDPGRYFDIQKLVVDIFSGEVTQLIIQEKRNDIPEEVITRIRLLEKEWIDSEKPFTILDTKISRIFFDVAIINVDQDDIYIDILDKTEITKKEILSLFETSKKYDYSIAVSAFFLSKRFPATTNESSDVIVGLMEYDIKNKEILSLNIKTINQLMRIDDSFPRHGLWEYVDFIFTDIEDAPNFISYLPLPIDVQDYTCLPWICYCFLQKFKTFDLEGYEGFDVPLMLVFGIPPILLRRPGYIFDQSSQKAIVMFGLNEDEDTLAFHQVRFDVSKGEPNLHFHYEIIKEGELDKIMNHEIINFKDIISFNENLGLGFLLASAYDVTFDRHIIPDRFEGVFDVLKENPMLIYPLFARSMVGEQCRTLLKDVEKREAFYYLVRNPHEAIDKEIIIELERMRLLRDGKLTILGNLAYVRLMQMEK